MSDLWTLIGLWEFADWARCAAGFLLCLAAVNLLALGAPVGAWRVIGVTLDDAECAALRAAALLLWAFGALLTCALGFGMGIFRHLSLAAALVSLLALLISLRFNLRLARPGMACVARIADMLRARIAGYLLYGVLCGILAVVREPMAVFGYAMGQLVLVAARLGVKESDTQANRRSSWLLLVVELTALFCIWLFPLCPSAFRFGIVLPIYALGLALVLGAQAHRLPILLIPTLSGLCILLPAPYSALVSGALFALFMALMRRPLYEAALPVRAFWIRKRAARR